MANRVYVVEDAQDQKTQRLVRASYSHMAERHVASQRYRARIASKDDLERLLTAGVRVEQADNKPPAND
jgi:hypothetical protein